MEDMEELAGSNIGCVNWLAGAEDDGKLVWWSIVGSAISWMFTLSEEGPYQKRCTNFDQIHNLYFDKLII